MHEAQLPCNGTASPWDDSFAQPEVLSQVNYGESYQAFALGKAGR